MSPQQQRGANKRNSRERRRVRTINTNFELLRRTVPTTAGLLTASKLNILNCAARYIAELQQAVEQMQQVPAVSPAQVATMHFFSSFDLSYSSSQQHSSLGSDCSDGSLDSSLSSPPSALLAPEALSWPPCGPPVPSWTLS